MARKDKPYLPLYVQDFMTDEKLMECSASATGVYIRIMCIMHKSEVYGTFLLKQKDKQIDQESEQQIFYFANKLAKFLPYDISIIVSGLTELINENVLYIDGDALIQKRMLSDGELSIIRSESGSKGGKATKERDSFNSFATAKQVAKATANNLANITAKQAPNPDNDIDIKSLSIVSSNENTNTANTIVLACETEEKVISKKPAKKADRLDIPDDSTEIRKERERYELEIVPTLRLMGEIDAKRKLAEYIQEIKPGFYEPYKDLWNMSARKNGLSKVVKMSDGRLRKFKNRIKDADFDFISVMMGIKKSNYLKGDNQRGWKVDFDFIFDNDTNYLKIMEGRYQ